MMILQYCDAVPALHPCFRGQVVTTHIDQFSLKAEKPIFSDSRVHCVCPDNYLFVKNASDFMELEGQGYSISVTYVCVPVSNTISEKTDLLITLFPVVLCPVGTHLFRW